MASSPTYLKKRKLGWYVQVAVPKQLHSILGTSPVLRSLKTRDKLEAHRKKHAVIAQILTEFQLAGTAPTHPRAASAAALLDLAVAQRQAVEDGQLSQREADLSHEARVDDFLEDQSRVLGIGADGHPRLPEATLKLVQRSFDVLSGRVQDSLSRLVEAYLKENSRVLTAQTIGDKRRRLDAFMEWFGGDRDYREVTRKVAGTYVTDVVQGRTLRSPDKTETPLSAKTKGKEVSDLRAFFQWLVDRGRLQENPFQRMARSIKDTTRAQPHARRAWRPEELSHLLQAVDSRDPIWAMTVIAAYSGMRREEVVELTVSDVSGETFRIERGKTKSANRLVPIHPVIAPMVNQLVTTSSDGFLISGLLRGGPDKKRGWYVGKRFGRVIRQEGLTDPQLDFHALRGTVVSQLEEAGVPLATIQLIVGHNRQGVTYKYYSQAGVSEKARREALVKVTYGELDQYILRTGPDVTIKPSAKPRRPQRTHALPSAG